MRFILVPITILVIASEALAQPGAKPVELCRYSEPEYLANEIDAINKYQQCVTNGQGREREQKRENCYQLSLKPEVDKQVRCGDTPEWRVCSLRNEAEECASTSRRNVPGRFSCDELLRRYPEIEPLVAACREMEWAQVRDSQTNAKSKTRCTEEYPQGYKLIQEKCRKVTQVVPP